MKKLNWKLNGDEPIKIINATQNDNTVADIVLVYPKEQRGISVKFDTNVSRNVTCLKFISKEERANLKEELKKFIPVYIEEMNTKYGDWENWFRQRKTSKSVNEFIEKIAKLCVNAWEQKSSAERKDVLDFLLDENFKTPYWILHINSKGKIQRSLPLRPKLDITKVFLKYREGSQYLDFWYEGDVTAWAKMQIKFNNGVLEKPKGKKSDGMLTSNSAEQKYVTGKPFGSWNFELLLEGKEEEEEEEEEEE